MHHREHALIIPTHLPSSPHHDRSLTRGLLGSVPLLGASAPSLPPGRTPLRRRPRAPASRRLRTAVHTGRDLAQRTVGAAIDAVPEVGQVSDAKLLERVRSQAIGTVDVDTSKVVTTVRDGGVVELRGQVDTDTRRRELLHAVADVDGVREVVYLTHLPHEPAPTRS